MAKIKAELKILNYGIYDKFDQQDKDLPTLIEFTDKIPARIGTEFGVTVEIRKARGDIMQWRIEHPPFCDSKGEPVAAFTGEFRVNGSEYKFFLGDSLFEPLADMLGHWHMTISCQGKELMSKKLKVVPLAEYLRAVHDI